MWVAFLSSGGMGGGGMGGGMAVAGAGLAGLAGGFLAAELLDDVFWADQSHGIYHGIDPTVSFEWGRVNMIHKKMEKHCNQK